MDYTTPGRIEQAFPAENLVFLNTRRRQFIPPPEEDGEFMLLYVKTKLDVVLYNAFPFNLLKGLVITGFTMLVYKRIRPLLKGRE